MEQKASVLSNIMQETLIKQLIADYFDEVVLIETETGRVLNISDRITCQKHNYRRYDGKTYNEQMLAIVRDDLPPAEREALQKAIGLDTVINELKTSEQYSVELVLPGPGSRAVCKNLVFKFLDQSRKIIVLVCQDVSEIELNGTDPLTGLYNSAGFHHKVEVWIKANPGKRFRIQRYNIDRFRDINGIYGYEVGNKLLRDFAGYMKRYNSANSFAAHLNADHFVRFCAEDALTVNECYNNFNDCFKNYELSLPIKLHMGVYDLCEPNCDSFTMSYKALLALQSIKGSLTKQIAYYEQGMMAVELEQQELLADLQTAIETGQFEVWFQPQVDYANKRLIGAEALVRWRHPKKGLISPAVFVPLLEKSDCIGRVDRLVFEKVCACISKWQREMKGAGQIPVSVNLSRNDIYRENLCSNMLKILQKHGLTPGAVHLEITESAYMENSLPFTNTLKQLRQAGFLVEMDDFGSGYSSLNSLKDLNIDKLKLDLKFLAGAQQNKKSGIIISAIINMAHALQLPVIAEGVETKEQAEMLLSFGCSQMQGYYFSKPVSQAEYESLLRQGTVGIANNTAAAAASALAEPAPCKA